MAQRQGRQGRGLGARLGATGTRRAALALVGVVAVLALVGVALLAGGSGGVVVRRQEGGASSTAAAMTVPAAVSEEPAPDPVVVHVDGAVASPGVYELELEAPRVNDAIRAAGGLLEEADTTALNLADLLIDGQKVHVPMAGEGVDEVTSDATSASGAAGAASSGTVNINTAGVEELDGLPGIGPSTAQAIVEDRQANGPFASVEDLMRVSGIGEKKFAKLEGKICV